MSAADIERQAKRRGTLDFINADPIVLSLIPVDAGVNDEGDDTETDGTPRDPQTFRLIPMTFNELPVVTAGGQERIISHTLLGAYDATMSVWDKWTGDDGTRYQIVALAPGHGYETKGLVEQHLPGR